MSTYKASNAEAGAQIQTCRHFQRKYLRSVFAILISIFISIINAGFSYANISERSPPFTVKHDQTPITIGSDTIQIQVDTIDAAMKAGEGFNNLSILNQHYIGPNQGTIAFWIMPVNWSSNDDSFHVFFEGQGETSFILYKYFENSKLVWFIGDTKKPDTAEKVEAKVDWKPGDWHHLAATWSTTGIKLYINGSLTVEKISQASPRLSPKNLIFGDSHWNTRPNGQTLVKEINFFSDALNAAEISTLARRNMTVLPEEFGIDARIRFGPESKDLELEIQAVENRFFLTDKYSVHLTVKSRPSRLGQRPYYSQKLQIGDLKKGISLPLNDDKMQEIEFSYEISDIKTTLANVSRRMELPREELITRPKQTNRIDTIPAPWNAIVVTNEKISTAYTSYKLCKHGLICSIENHMTQLLQQPITIELKRDGRTLRAVSQPATLSESNKNIVEFDYSVSLEDLGDIVIEGYVEYDGMLWLDIYDRHNSIFSAREIDISIHIPLAIDDFRYIHHWNSDWSKSNIIMGGSFLKTNLPFTPYVWLGNDNRGFFWFSESTRGWPNAAHNDAIIIEKTHLGALLKLNLKRSGQLIEKGHPISFGLLPTPAKPVPTRSYNLRLAPNPGAQAAIIWPDNTESSFKYYGSAIPKKPTAYLQRIDSLRQKKILAIPYICPTFISSDAPEWKVYRDEWDVGIYDSTSRDVLAYGAMFALVSPNSESWRNYIINSALEYHKNYFIDGIYLDNIQLYGIYAPAKEYGFIRGKEIQKTFPMRAQRKIIELLYRHIKAANPDAVIIGHSSGRLALPILSFVDIYVDGEQFRGKIEDSYLKSLTLDEFRAEFTGKQFGLQPLFLPQPVSSNRTKKTTTGLMTLAALHDVNVWPIWSDAVYIGRFYEKIDRLIPEDSVFYNYSSASNAFLSDNPSLLVSSYCNQKSECLVVAGNISSNTENGNVCSKFGELNYVVYDIIRGPTKDSESTCINVSIKAEGHLLIRSNGK